MTIKPSIEELTSFYARQNNDWSFPEHNKSYLHGIRDVFSFNPSVIYDIGSAVLHWTKVAKGVWPNARIIAFDAVMELENFYKSYPTEYYLGVLSDIDGKEIKFYENAIYIGGNSYYKESSKYSKIAESIYDSEHERIRKTITVDSVAKLKNFPLPDMIKIDVQGAELDILRGMPETLKSVKHLIVELQHVEYNVGAKLVNESIPFIESLGFKLSQPSMIHPADKNSYFCGNGPDADYHFIRI